MPRRIAGVSLIGISAMLYAAHYLTATVWGSGLSSYNPGLFPAMLSYISPGLRIWTWVALVAGVIYLVWGEASERKSR